MGIFENIVRKILFESVAIGDTIQAIQNKKKVRINYMGDNNIPRGERTIQPYVVGKTKRGNLAIRAYQEQGATATITPGWKIFLLNKITQWNELGENFQIRQDYAQGDKSFPIITQKI